MKKFSLKNTIIVLLSLLVLLLLSVFLYFEFQNIQNKRTIIDNSENQIRWNIYAFNNDWQKIQLTNSDRIPLDWKYNWRVAANIIWYLDWDEPMFWIEEYYNNELRQWKDIVLSINLDLQKKIEEIADRNQKDFIAESVNVMVMDADNWEIKASVNAPMWDLNNLDSIYDFIPITEENNYLLNDPSYKNIRIFVKEVTNDMTGYVDATEEQRLDNSIQKYVYKNLYWSSIFIDNNIGNTHEPWNIFKPFAYAVWVELWKIKMEELYVDKWYLEVWPEKIYNSTDWCEGTNSFKDSLIKGCNVWTINVIARIGNRYDYFNKLNKLWFGKLTNIDSSLEDNWYLDDSSTVPFLRFLYNSLWLWLTVTNVQLATAYSSLINGWYRIQPTITKKDDVKKEAILSNETSRIITDALKQTVEQNSILSGLLVKWVNMWGISWTSQIPYDWIYWSWAGRTNWDFAWYVDIDWKKYVIIVQVMRPRTDIYWSNTAWSIFKEIVEIITKGNLIN